MGSRAGWAHKKKVGNSKMQSRNKRDARTSAAYTELEGWLEVCGERAGCRARGAEEKAVSRIERGA